MTEIVRYKNRHLYELAAKRYTTLRECKDRLEKGEDLRFVCFTSKRDITQEMKDRIKRFKASGRLTERGERHTKGIFVRYANRKLYSREKSEYIVLDYLLKEIREGKEVTVIDNKTLEDITKEILIKSLIEEIRCDKNLDRESLTWAAQNGGVSGVISNNRNEFLKKNVIELKRYKNRKLYDIRMARYVNTSEIAEFLENNNSINVVNHDGKENHTVVTLINVLEHQLFNSDISLHEIKAVTREGGIGEFILGRFLRSRRVENLLESSKEASLVY